MLTRHSDYTFKNGSVTKNRVVVPPMASQTADAQGFATEKTIEHYKRLSESGAGIVFAEYSFVHQSGKGEPHQLGVDHENKIEGLRKIAAVIQKQNALAGLQIVHVGGKSTTELTGQPLIGPSCIPVPIKDRTLETPNAADIDQVRALENWYFESALRAEKAGFDLVELHAAHGYGLNQWLSPVTNQRTDAYGGSISGRSQLLRSVVQRIREALPNMLISVRMPAEDHFPGGLSRQEMAWVAQSLESLGIDLIDVSSGIGGWRRPRGFDGQGYLVSDATFIKEHVHLPVIGVGGIEDGDFIDQLLLQSKVDFAAVGRAILKDPAEWGNRNLSSRK